MSRELRESHFWRQWLLIGAIGGVAGNGLLVLLLFLVEIIIGRPTATASDATLGYTVIELWGYVLLIPAGLYGYSQGIAQRLFLRQQTPKLRRSIQVHFSAIIVATIVNGLLLIILLSLKNIVGDSFRAMLSFGMPLFVTTAGFVVGGAGGIAQAIVTRFLLRSVVCESYLRWIVPLALWGHVSGGIAGAISCFSSTLLGQSLLFSRAG